MPASTTPKAASFALRVQGRVTSSTYRLTRYGVPVVVLELQNVASGQTVRISHHYPHAGTASHMAARALAAHLRGQSIKQKVSNPRFKAGRLECDADLITLPPTTAMRADLV